MLNYGGLFFQICGFNDSSLTQGGSSESGYFCLNG